MPDDAVMVDPRYLETYVSSVFGRVGMAGDDADFCAKALVQSDLWGKSSHGVMRLPHYVRRMQSGAVNPRPATRMLHGTAPSG